MYPGLADGFGERLAVVGKETRAIRRPSDFHELMKMRRLETACRSEPQV